MTADPQPPTAIRITRPYASEDEFLDHELDTLSRTGVLLLGAQQRPEGVMVRFELALATGQILIRGEGRVVGFKMNAHGDMPGLSLRFTRLDVRSKALIDKATALRERRRPSMQMPRMETPTSPRVPGPPPLPPLARVSMPPPSSVMAMSTSNVMPMSNFVPIPASTDSSRSRTAVETPAERESLLSRLRSRHRSLASEVVQNILQQRRHA